MGQDSNSPEVRELIEKDQYLRQQMHDYGYGQSDSILDILYKRYQLYVDYTGRVRDKDSTILIRNMKEGVEMEIMLFKSKFEIEKQISEVISRVDALEAEVEKLKK